MQKIEKNVKVVFTIPERIDNWPECFIKDEDTFTDIYHRVIDIAMKTTSTAAALYQVVSQYEGNELIAAIFILGLVKGYMTAKIQLKEGLEENGHKNY